MQREQILGADIDTIPTAGAFGAVHHRQCMAVHVDGVEIAGPLAVAVSEAAPVATLAAARHLGSRETGGLATVAGPVAGHVAATGTGQARHDPGLRSHRNTQVIGDSLASRVVAHRTLARRHHPAHQRLGKWPATGIAAGTAIGVRQHLLYRIDAQVFCHVEFSVGENQQAGKQKRQPANGHHCGEHHHVRNSPAIAFPEAGYKPYPEKSRPCPGESQITNRAK